MKLNSKRLLLSAGTLITVAAPIVTVVSCGNVYEPTEDDLKIYRDLTSPTAYKMIQGMWLEQVIVEKGIAPQYKPNYDLTTNVVDYDLDNVNSAKVKEAAQYLINSKIQTDPEYLKKMADTLTASGKTTADGTPGSIDKYSKDWLRDNGILRTYPKGVIQFEGQIINNQPALTAANIKTNNNDTNLYNDGITNEGLEFIFQSQLLDFRLDVYKFMVTTWYLENTSKAEYELAFKTRISEGNSDINSSIFPEDYLLIKEMISNKYFAKWEIELPTEQSRRFVGRQNMTFSEAIDQLDREAATGDAAAMFGTNTFAALAKYSEQEKTLITSSFSDQIKGDIQDTGSTKYENLLGFKGFTQLSTQGTKALSFTNDEMKKMKMDDTPTSVELSKNWEGFIVKDDLNRNVAPTDLKEDGIPYIADKQQVAKLTFVKGIMPAWNGTNYVLNVVDADKAVYKHAVAMFLAANKSDYYNDAAEFARTKGTSADGNTVLEPTILKINEENGGDRYKEILIDAGYKFVEERNV